MTNPLRVGIIGASANRGWAKESHVVAVQKLAGLELAAIATRRQETADAAAKAFGAQSAYGNPADLIRDPGIDLVAVCVRVPNHRELVLSAIAAGKHIYCEWPLGRNITETEEMAAAAHNAGVHVAIGLQARMSPAVHRACDLITAGEIGRVLSARLYSSTGAFGEKMAAADAYLENAENGATLIAIHGGHALDLASMVLGQIEEVSALTTIQYPEIEVGDDSKQQARSIPDHLLVQAHLMSGAVLSIEVAGGRPPGSPFRLEVIGEKGVLALGGGALRGFPTGRLHLSLNAQPQPINEGELEVMPDTAANVAGVYAALRDDIAHGSAIAPDFTHAVHLARLVDVVESSAQTGTRSKSRLDT